MQIRDYSAPQYPTFTPELVNPLNGISFRNRLRMQPDTDLDLREQPLPPSTTSYEVPDRSQPSVSSF